MSIFLLSLEANVRDLLQNVSVDPPTKVMYDPEPENSLLEIYYLYTLPESELVMIVGARNIEDQDEDKAIDCIIGSSYLPSCRPAELSCAISLRDEGR